MSTSFSIYVLLTRLLDGLRRKMILHMHTYTHEFAAQMLRGKCRDAERRRKVRDVEHHRVPSQETSRRHTRTAITYNCTLRKSLPLPFVIFRENAITQIA